MRFGGWKSIQSILNIYKHKILEYAELFSLFRANIEEGKKYFNMIFEVKRISVKNIGIKWEKDKTLNILKNTFIVFKKLHSIF